MVQLEQLDVKPIQTEQPVSQDLQTPAIGILFPVHVVTQLVPSKLYKAIQVTQTVSEVQVAQGEVHIMQELVGEM